MKQAAVFLTAVFIFVSAFAALAADKPVSASVKAGVEKSSSVKKDDGGSAAPSGPVYYVKTEGVVNPVMAEYLIKAIGEAQKTGAAAVVIEIDTPGGLDLSMRDIIKAVLASEVPVVVYVAPSGARAASAGVFITYAAHIAAMAPGTNIGSAHPVAMGGEKMDETMVKKVENDAAAQKILEAADLLSKNPMSLQLRYLQTLTEVAAEKNSTTIFPIPIDLLTPFIKDKIKGDS